MPINADRSSIARLSKELANLQKKDAQEAKKEATAAINENRAIQAASKTTSTSTKQMKLREAERYRQQAINASNKRADYASKIAVIQQKLSELNQRVAKAEQEERKKESDRISQLTRQLEIERRSAIISLSDSLSKKTGYSEATAELSYDVFISHASEDKDSFVRPFAEALKTLGLRVWYDEHTLDWGDSLRREIDRGLASSKFGVVVISRHFFKKEWPQAELDGLLTREIEGVGKVLPIWHNISKNEVLKVSPILGNKLALNTSIETIDEIAEKLYKLCSNK